MREPIQQHNDAAEKRVSRCFDFEGFKQWQMQEYRSAVQALRKRLSEEAGYDVGWHIAEFAFCNSSCSSRAKEWRAEYCRDICSHRDSCLLGRLFLRKFENEQCCRRATA